MNNEPWTRREYDSFHSPTTGRLNRKKEKPNQIKSNKKKKKTSNPEKWTSSQDKTRQGPTQGDKGLDAEGGTVELALALAHWPSRDPRFFTVPAPRDSPQKPQSPPQTPNGLPTVSSVRPSSAVQGNFTYRMKLPSTQYMRRRPQRVPLLIAMLLLLTAGAPLAF